MKQINNHLTERKRMKKLMMIACMMLFSTAMFADKGDIMIGGGISYGIHSDYKNFGIGVKGSYELMENLRAAAQVDHFFLHEDVQISDINVNLEYAFPVSDAINVYPLAGLAFVGHSSNSFGFLNSAKIGFNIGAGAPRREVSDREGLGTFRAHTRCDVCTLKESLNPDVTTRRQGLLFYKPT